MNDEFYNVFNADVGLLTNVHMLGGCWLGYQQRQYKNPSKIHQRSPIMKTDIDFTILKI